MPFVVVSGAWLELLAAGEVPADDPAADDCCLYAAEETWAWARSESMRAELMCEFVEEGGRPLLLLLLPYPLVVAVEYGTGEVEDMAVCGEE